MRLDDTKDNQSVKSAGIVLHAEVKAHALLSLLGNNKGCKTNTHTHRHLRTKSERKQFFIAFCLARVLFLCCSVAPT